MSKPSPEDVDFGGLEVNGVIVPWSMLEILEKRRAGLLSRFPKSEVWRWGPVLVGSFERYIALVIRECYHL